MPLVAAVACCLALATAAACGAAEIDAGFEQGAIGWSIVDADCRPRVSRHAVEQEAAHRGSGGEHVVIEAATGTTLRLQFPVGAARVIDEFHAAVWVRANRPGLRLAARVVLPGFPAARTGRPVELLVPGGTSHGADRWELVEIRDIAATLDRQLAAIRAQHGTGGSTAGAIVTHVVLDAYSGPGLYDLAIDDLKVEGIVESGGGAVRDAAVRPAALTEPGEPAGLAAAEPQAALARGVLEVGGRPFFPRSIDHNGEPLDLLARLGFNCVRLSSPASADLLAEARRAGVWLICPPPELPDVDIRDPESLPTFSARWDRVLFWDMGAGLSEADAATLAERGRRVRTCDSRSGRPLIATADSGLRTVSRHVDMMVARRTVLGTSLELADYLSWLRERPRLARPGTPFLAALSTEVDSRTARQAAALSGIGGQGLAVDPESLCLAAFSAVAAGTRGILFSSAHRLDGDDRESRARAAACQGMNLDLRLLEPWGAAGRFSVQAQSSDPEVQAVVLEASRARLLLAWRCVQGSQVVARHYHGDIPRDSQPLTLLVPGVPEAHQAWEVAAGGLRPLRHKRVTGGISLTLESFHAHSMVLLSGDPGVTAHLQERVRELAPLTLASARALADVALADDASLLGRLPPAALGTLPVAAMLVEAQRSVQMAASAADAAQAIGALDRGAAVAGQVQRLAWERGVLATGSMVASPLSTSDATLAEHWRFIEALAATSPGEELLPGGGMERIEDLAGNGWRHFALSQEEIGTAVEIDRAQPAAGRGSLTIRAEPSKDTEPPVVVETPPVWVTTPGVRVPTGKLLQIQARVWVPAPIKGSVDGLLVFDSLGGPALAERIGATGAWRRLVLYRIAPPDAVDEPLTVTFALTGIGEARIDDVSVRVLERGVPGIPAALVSAPAAAPATGFPGPGDLLAAPAGAMPQHMPPGLPAPDTAAAPATPAAPLTPATPAAPATAPATAGQAAQPQTGQQWPGMSLEWPKLLPFGQSPNAPPAGPGGGTVDPFKRARAAQPQ